MAANSLLNRSWSALGSILERCRKLLEAPRSDLGDIANKKKKQEHMQARRNAQACSRWFTIVLGGNRRLAVGGTPRPFLTRSAPLLGAADLIAHAHSAGPGDAGPRACGDAGPRGIQKCGLLGSSWDRFLASWAALERPWRCPGEARRGPGEALEASWGPLGALRDA